MKNEHGLTQQQELFACAVAEGLTQSDAYKRAYPSSLKWKRDSVHQKAATLAADVRIKARVQALQAKVAEVAVLKAADIIEETRRLALSTPAGIIGIDAKGKAYVKMPNELDAATAAAVASFEIDDLGRIKYRFWDKNSSLERAARILGLFGKDHAQAANPLVALLGRLAGNVVEPVASVAAFDADDGDGDGVFKPTNEDDDDDQG